MRRVRGVQGGERYHICCLQTDFELNVHHNKRFKVGNKRSLLSIPNKKDFVFVQFCNFL